MTKLWQFIRHNSGMVVGCTLAAIVLTWAYGCQSQVRSIVNPVVFVNRGELHLEVDHFVSQAELKFQDLDKQDEFKQALFDIAINFMETGQVNPIGVAMTIATILGVAAGVDNVRKRTHINTLKGGNGKANEKTT